METIEGWRVDQEHGRWYAFKNGEGYVDVQNSHLEVVSDAPWIRPIVHVPIAVIRRLLELTGK